MAHDPTLSERQARDEALMAELRANRGHTDSGQTLVILTITGPRIRHPDLNHHDGGSWCR
jgi:hypothetical protein